MIQPRILWSSRAAVLSLAVAGSLVTAAPGHARSAMAPNQASASASAATGNGNGAGPGTTDPGFDVTGSHPLPNAGDQEPPGRGACGCTLGRPPSDGAPRVAVLACVLVVMRSRRRCAINA